MNFRLLIIGFAVMFVSTTNAQMTGITFEVDTAFYGPNTPSPEDTFDPLGTLDGYVTYKVYAEFTNTTDVLSAIYSDVAVLGTIPMEIDAPCGCFNPVATSVLMDASNSSFFWDAFPLWQYDSYWTIGMESSDAPGDIPQSIDLPDGSDICSSSISDGALFVLSSPINAVAGTDLRILIAQVTTCGDWCLGASFHVFVEGVQANPQFFEPTEQICISNPCEPYISQDATVSGAVLPCAGGSSTVEVEFLGVGDPSLATYVLLDQGGEVIVGPQGSSSFDDLSPGNYSMVIMDEFTCIDTTSFAVTAPGPILAEFELVSDNDCFGEGDATVCLLAPGASGGSGDLLISVLDPVGSDVASVGGANECWTDLVCQDGDGSFTFSINDSEGCALDTVLFVNCPLPIEALVTTIDIDCQGNANGSIGAEASGGSGDLFIVVNSDTLLLPDTVQGLVPGNYNVQIIDIFDCSTGTEVVEVLEPDDITLQIVSAAPITCGSDCNGAVDLLYFGGTGFLTLEITDALSGLIASSQDSLCASEYVASIMDDNGCITNEPFLIDAPPPLTFLISTTSATCTGMSNGSADIFPAGGTGELTWMVTDTLGNVANLNNLSEMTYTAIVTDVLGCQITDTFSIDVAIITDMILTTFPSPVTCWNAEDGTITVSIDGGDSPFTYLWSDPFDQTSSTAIGLTEDTYTVTVTDAVGCNLTVSEAITHIEGCLFIADALTPNGDGYNDEWIVGGLLDFPQSEVKVYNRWGQLLFFSDEGDVHWDGRFNNQRLPVADYYYTIELSPYDPPITGTVSLKY
ncbi:MAG: T9SS type B sorting domain-containing protein [Bacteroidetes bacterium]|nr:T9SS type B sorting domain-containing protein [Bacteroidota bacterium]MDA1383199.1 T9SS type B sorting domain-containing protein [Bacteroidota bacterium]